MKPILKNYDKEVEGGFYYDNQRKNELTKISLHANAVPPDSEYNIWPSWGETITDDKIDKDFKDLTDPDGKAWEFGEEKVFPEDKEKSKIDGKDVRYGKQSLCNSILSEDFNVSVANNWGDFSAGQSLENTFNGLKGYEPYLGKAQGLFKQLTEGISNYQSNVKNTTGENAGKYTDYLKKASDFFGKISESGNKILRRSLVVQGTRFKYYSGTGISFSNLGMRFTLFPDYFGGKFKTVDDQLAALLPYSVGKFVDFINKKDEEMSEIANGVFNRLSEDIKKETIGDLNKFLGWQIPPGGFKAAIEYIDYIQVGTLMLKLGPYYKLKSLVIQDIQLNYSKHNSKYVDLDDNNKLKTCPLFCDVAITFTPSNKYSDKKLKEFVMSSRTSSSSSDKEITDLEDTINSRLIITNN